MEVDSISKEISCAEHEYMNMSPSLVALAPPLNIEIIIIYFHNTITDVYVAIYKNVYINIHNANLLYKNTISYNNAISTIKFKNRNKWRSNI